MRPLETAPSSCPARPTRCKPARDGLRRLHLDHEVDGAHVDAQLERRGGDEARDLALLQQLLHLDPLLARERAVVRTRQLALRQLVQAQREPLRQAAVVDEDDRRAVLLDQPQDLGVDRRPDRAGAELRARIHLLPVGGRGIRERGCWTAARACPPPARRPRGRAPSHARRRRARSAGRRRRSGRSPPCGRCVAERPMRCTGDGRSWSRRSTVSARWAPRFVPATACTSSRISVSTVRSISRACDVRMRKSDSGVVIRMSGGLRAICWRSFCGVSPVRTATRSSERSPASGPRRLRSTS